MVKHLQTEFSVLLVSIVDEAFATKRQKNVFFVTSVCKFFSYVVVLVIILLQLWKVINIVCINTTNFKYSSVFINRKI